MGGEPSGQPTTTWHQGEDMPHLTYPPTPGPDGKVSPEAYQGYLDALRALDDCPHSGKSRARG